jgi:hypothetical protein
MQIFEYSFNIFKKNIEEKNLALHARSYILIKI